MQLKNIYDKITERGWNLYITKDSETIQLIVPRGPVSKLEVGNQYLLFPKVKDPKNLEQITKAITTMVKTCRYPLINFNGLLMPLAYFKLNPTNVIVRAQLDFELEYSSFEKSLDALLESYKLVN